MPNRKLLLAPQIVPVLRIEPPNMFVESVLVPSDPQSLQRLFRRATAGTPLSKIEFVPGSELLLPISSVMPFLDTVAQICSQGVTSMGEAELAGGYAFLENGAYLFGVEDDSILYDTLQWDEAPALLRQYGEARIHHACDHFIHVRKQGEMVILRHERSQVEYGMNFKLFENEIQKASSQLQEFAVAFTPIYADYLAMETAYDVALENFKNRPHWFARRCAVAVG